MFLKKDFFSDADKQLLAQAIQQAEQKTSGEVRIFIEPHCKGDLLLHAQKVFHSLKMDETSLHNGVLFYLAYKDKRFAIYGDEGIHKKVGDNFWADVSKLMEGMFQQQQFVPGLQKGIELAGEKLRLHFPRETNDKDELSNEVIIR